MDKNTPYTYSEMENDISSLCSKYSFLTVSSIGKSLVGRSIPLISLGAGKKSVLYVGTHHGMEWITSILLIKYVNDMCEYISKKGSFLGHDAEEFFFHRKVYVVPMLNPDGVELQINGRDDMNPLTERLYTMSGGDFSFWQANGRGVDLNHNYDAGFDEYKKLERDMGIPEGAPTKYSGAYPFSEPECSCLASFIRSTDISMLIALHTQGEEIYYDYNGHIPKSALTIAKKLSDLSGYALSKPEGSACYGGLKDWFISEFYRPAYTIECGKGVNPLPQKDANIIYEQVKKMLFLSPSFV